MIQAYGLWREDRGYSRRAIVILDGEGIVRHSQVIERGAPDVEAILQVVRQVAQAAERRTTDD
jgi:alkyl hydroperoxide reductase subunit AhpC